MGTKRPPASSYQAVHYFFYGLYFGDQVADLAYFNFAFVYVALKDAFAGAAFAKDEMGWWGGSLYQSLLESNVHTPDAYPAGWEKVQEK